MDTRSKIIFLQEVLARKTDLFSKTDSKHKDELWHEVYDVCVSKGCIGLRDAEYLRRTTYQNLQRRAKEKYEKGLKMGMSSVTLSEIDELVLDIIGRDKCIPTSQDNLLNEENFQSLLGFITKNDPTANNFKDSIQSSPYSMNNDFEEEKGINCFNQRMKTESPPISNGNAYSSSNGNIYNSANELDMQPKLPEVITSLFQSFVTNNTQPISSQLSNIQQQSAQSNGNMKGKNKRARMASPEESENEDDDQLMELDEQLLRKRKLHAEIRLIDAQKKVQDREAKLKDLQIMALKRELGISN